MSDNTKVKVHSDVAIEIIGTNMKPKMNLDKDGKVASVETKWQANKKNRFDLKKGKNMVPVECLDWPMFKTLEAKGHITIDRSNVKKAKKEAEKEAGPTTVKKKAVKSEETE